MGEAPGAGWLLLVHRIPPKPSYFRVKVWRRLQGLGAVPIKNSVYVLPKSDQAREDFQWVLREIVQQGGEASVCDARFVDGLTDAEVGALFSAARGAEYARLAREARETLESLSAAGRRSPGGRGEAASALRRLRKRLAEIAAIDFFGAPGREAAEGFLGALADRLAPARPGAEDEVDARAKAERLKNLRAQTWVTRRGVHVDRMASAWLIRRFIDPQARFRFMSSKRYRPRPGEVRFDMFEAEYTHEGDRCTFEVLTECAGLKDPALRPLGEIVHDIDLRDGKFGRPEVPGVARLIDGIAMAHKDDEGRLKRGEAIFEDLYAYYRTRRPASGRGK